MTSVLLIVIAFTAAAKENCDSVPRFREIAKTARALKPQRKTSVGFAKDHSTTPGSVEKIFGATGDFECGGFWGQAQLTETDHHITTAGHMWFNASNCTPLEQKQKCKFIVNVEGKPKEFNVKGLVDAGCEKGSDVADEVDWAVLELEQAVPASVEPYKTDKNLTNKIEAGKALVSVGKSKDFKVKGSDGTKHADFPKHFTDCGPTEVRRLFSGDEPNLFATNCPTNYMSSGGSLVDMSTAKPILVGVEVGQLREDKAHYFVPVTGKLAQTLNSLRSGSN